LGWIETEKLSRFEFTVNNSLGKLFFNLKKKKERLQKFLIAKKGLDNSAIADGFGGVYRDEAYFDYKGFSNSYVLRISCAELWVKTNKSLIIGDIKLMTDDRKHFFKEVKEVAKKLGVDKITFQVSPNCSIHNFFSESHKPTLSFSILFQDFGSGIPLEKIKFTFSDIDIF
jgi:hypothetical protein